MDTRPKRLFGQMFTQRTSRLDVSAVAMLLSKLTLSGGRANHDPALILIDNLGIEVSWRLENSQPHSTLALNTTTGFGCPPHAHCPAGDAAAPS